MYSSGAMAFGMYTHRGGGILKENGDRSGKNRVRAYFYEFRGSGLEL
jgi:hypothetical protein